MEVYEPSFHLSLLSSSLLSPSSLSLFISSSLPLSFSCLSSPSPFHPPRPPPSQVDRNLQDAMQVARNIVTDPYLVPGGGATEMALAQALNERAKSVAGVQQWPYRAVSKALEVIPRTLLQNCGANTIRVLTTLRVSCWNVISSMATDLMYYCHSNAIAMPIHVHVWTSTFVLA